MVTLMVIPMPNFDGHFVGPLGLTRHLAAVLMVISNFDALVMTMLFSILMALSWLFWIIFSNDVGHPH